MRETNNGFTLVELMVVSGIIMILASILLPIVGKAKESSRRAVCISNIRQILIAVSVYAEEHNGRYPQKDEVPENLIVNGESIFPEYISSLNVFGCPSSILFEENVSFTKDGNPDPKCLTSNSYIYSGYFVTREEEAIAGTQAFTNGFGQQIGPYPFETFDDDIDLSVIGLNGLGNFGLDKIYRLNTKREDNFYVDTSYLPSRGTPIIMDQMGPSMFFFSHRPLGVNVGYMDGHVEFILFKPPLDAKSFPMSPFMVMFAQGHTSPDLSDTGCR